MKSLNHNGRSSTTAVANRSTTKSSVFRLEYTIKSADNTRSRAADGMSQSYSTTMNIHSRHIQVQDLSIGNGYNREGLVDLVVLDILQRQTSMLHSARDSIRRCDGELNGVTSSITIASDLEQRLQVVLTRKLSTDHNHRCSAIIQLGGVGSSDGSILHEGRLERAHLVQLSAERLLITRDQSRLLAFLRGDGDGCNFSIEQTSSPGSIGALITLCSKVILVLAGDVVLSSTCLTTVTHVLVVVDVP
mmetsp:Transcript_11525/g.23307  ORF Transcript_11525/g.23307 Transcript_11525/m.23307 type:complete len:247 (-) Transcript_11525:582-1322(-)